MVPGPLFDFGLHMFHNSKLMMKDGNGPFFYLPKVICCVFVIENPLCNEHLPLWYLVNLCFNTSNKHLLPHLPPLVFFTKKYWYRIKLLLLSLLFSFYNGIVTCKRVVSFLSSHPQYLSWTMASIYGHLNNNTVTVCWWKNKRIRSTFQHPGCHPVQLTKWFIF